MSQGFEINEVLKENLDYVLKEVCPDELDLLSDESREGIKDSFIKNGKIDYDDHGDMNFVENVCPIINIVLLTINNILIFWQNYQIYKNNTKGDNDNAKGDNGCYSIDHVDNYVKTTTLDNDTINIITDRKGAINNVIRKLIRRISH